MLVAAVTNAVHISTTISSLTITQMYLR